MLDSSMEHSKSVTLFINFNFSHRRITMKTSAYTTNLHKKHIPCIENDGWEQVDEEQILAEDH